MNARALVLLALVPAALGCTSTTVTHHELSAASGTTKQMGFGVGTTSAVQSSFGSSSSTTDVRVEHAADVTPGGEVDRFWRFALESRADLRQVLELCTGSPGAPRACTRATVANANGPGGEIAGTYPALLEPGNLGASLRSETNTGTVWAGTQAVQVTTQAQSGGRLVKPATRPATPAFGVWVLTEAAGTVPTIIGNASLVRTGGLLFCHAPPGAPPRCHPVPADVHVSHVLAVHLLRRGESLRHVVWAETFGGTMGSTSTGIVRCEAGDSEASPTCQPAEVRKT